MPAKPLCQACQLEETANLSRVCTTCIKLGVSMEAPKPKPGGKRACLPRKKKNKEFTEEIGIRIYKHPRF